MRSSLECLRGGEAPPVSVRVLSVIPDSSGVLAWSVDRTLDRGARRCEL